MTRFGDGTRLVACIPKEESRQVQLFQCVPPGTELPRVYEGSVERACESCGCIVMVGPKQQVMIAAMEAARAGHCVLCFLCAIVVTAAVTGEQIPVVDLGGSHEGPS